MNRDLKAAARALGHAISEAQDFEGWGKKGRAAMRMGKDELLDAIGLQMKRRGDWFGHAALGFGVGALVGATLALFLTPRTGNELREDLSERGRRVMQKGREMAEQYTSNGSNQTRPQS